MRWKLAELLVSVGPVIQSRRIGRVGSSVTAARQTDRAVPAGRVGARAGRRRRDPDRGAGVGTEPSPRQPSGRRRRRHGRVGVVAARRAAGAAGATGPAPVIACAYLPTG